MISSKHAHIGRYRIHAVAEMTGVAAATLRAWERRYHVPNPGRTEAAYRLYSDADVELVRRMRALCSGGHSAAEAARLLKETPLEDTLEIQPQDPWTHLRDDLLKATEAYDYTAMQEHLQRLAGFGPASLVYEHVLQPVMVEIGSRWHRGEISVAQEHMLSHQIETTLRNMLQMVQAADALMLALLTCYEGDSHSLGLYGIGLRLAGWGFRVVVMTPGLPPSGVRDAVQALQPHLVALSCVQSAERFNVKELTAGYGKACGNVPWIVGGAGSESLRELIAEHGGVQASHTMADVRMQLSGLLGPRR